ncbi:glycosyltransferase [Hyunsoonleella sp. SJ7]|uniref:Glycosyltransferase n=1 Tax=Hyunsoonleella aquatilis TaxID=2762758 RepID=A0A923H9S3_9FLAO|nr:glycosyltransferase [Hyunsoonleella aquatilis]MBC3757049.1 glycosyltransferase [Hyunsoonleella aquatilis]
MIVFSLIVVLSYLLLIGSFIVGFDKVKSFHLKDVPAKTKFTVVIPFRNEAENLPKLLHSISLLNYPKDLFEVILVDDASEDHSKEIIETFLEENAILNFQIVANERQTESPKKDAIDTAINKAKHEWIITTDADCVLPKFWLECFDEFIQQTDSICIAGPVMYHDGTTFLGRFQQLDLFSLQGAGVGGFGLKKPFLCNGANFGYTKTTFQEVNGFEGNTNISSGDDIFLLEKFTSKFPDKVHYLKCEKAIVKTNPQPTWHELMQQRLRWASKAKAYNNWIGKLTGIIVLLINILALVLPFLAIAGLFNFKIWVYLLVIKLNIDFLLLYKTATFFGQKKAFLSFLTSFSFYPFFSVHVGLLSLFGGYSWKGRKFKL